MPDESQILVPISKHVFNLLPGLVFISGMAEIDPSQQPDVEGIKTYLHNSWQKLQQNLANENSPESVRVSKWVEALKSVGIKVKDFPPSIQAISKRALKGGEPFSINPIVDTYNAISMELALPLGAYNLAELNGTMQVRLSSGGEKFIGLGSSEDGPTLPGEIVFSDDQDILTRMFLWRQSNKAKITKETQKFIFVSELLNVMGEDILNLAKARIVEKMEGLLKAKISNLTVQKARGNL